MVSASQRRVARELQPERDRRAVADLPLLPPDVLDVADDEEPVALRLASSGQSRSGGRGGRSACRPRRSPPRCRCGRCAPGPDLRHGASSGSAISVRVAAALSARRTIASGAALRSAFGARRRRASGCRRPLVRRDLTIVGSAGRRFATVDAELAQLALVDRRRRAGQRVAAGGGLREGDHVADRVGAGGERARSGRSRRRCRRAAARRSAAPRAGSRSAPRPPRRRSRAASKHLLLHRSGSLIRIEPPPISLPFQTRS